jgi:hypothetical protein
MKNLFKSSIFICFLISLFSCSTFRKNQVKEISYEAENQRLTYLNSSKDTIPAQRAFAAESDHIDIRIEKINPLVQEFSVNLSEPVLYYQNPSSLLNTYFIQKDEEKDTDSGNKSNPGPLIITKNTPADIINAYKTFNNIISDFSEDLSEFKTLKSLNAECVCASVKAIKTKIDSDLDLYTKEITKRNCSTIFICSDAYSASELRQIYKRILFDLDTTSKRPEKTPIFNELRKINEEAKSKKDSLIQSIIEEYARLLSLNLSQTFYNQPVNHSDEFNLNIVVKNNLTKSTLTYPIHLPVNKMVKIDFSAGFFYAGHTNQNFTKNKLNDSTYSLSFYDESKATFGPMGVINFHTAVCRGFNIGAFVGSGLSFNDKTKVTFAAGGSLILGKHQRLLIHGGVSFAEVNRVSSMYNNETFKDAAYDPKTIQKWDTSFMLGMTWNLSTTK